MSRRRKYAERELDELQKLKYENSKLKKQISSLRKQLSRVDIDRYENLKDLLYKHSNEDLEDKIKAQRKELKKRWKCHEANCDGLMMIQTVNVRGTIKYRRSCTDCNNATSLKLYTSDVKGLRDEE